MPNELFRNWLSRTRDLQEEAYARDYGEFASDATAPEVKVRALVDYISWNTKAATHELVELDAETSWKPWQMDKPYVHRAQVIGEAVDALHFIANILAAVGCTDAELDRRYLAKMQVNRERQLGARGYYVNGDGVKCRRCRRALDGDVPVSERDLNLCTLCEGES